MTDKPRRWEPSGRQSRRMLSALGFASSREPPFLSHPLLPVSSVGFLDVPVLCDCLFVSMAFVTGMSLYL